MTINRIELLSALTKDGCKIEYTDLAFSNEGPLHQGVRIYLCKKGNNYLSFASAQTEVIHALFFEMVFKLDTQSIPCQNIDQIVKFMNKSPEEKHNE
jgi:hypothetical protein